jgi:hypothetical protein
MRMLKITVARCAALAIGLGIAPCMADDTAQVTLDNTTITSGGPAAVGVNAASSAPVSGQIATVNVVSGTDVVAVKTGSGTPSTLMPLAQTLSPLNPPVHAVVDAATAALAQATSSLTTAVAPVRDPLRTMVNPPVQSALGSLGTALPAH